MILGGGSLEALSNDSLSVQIVSELLAVVRSNSSCMAAASSARDEVNATPRLVLLFRHSAKS